MNVGSIIELFDFDATSLGAEDIWYFTKSNYTDVAVRWKGNTYTPIDIIIEGFEMSGQGALPRPKISIGNVTRAMVGALISWDDLLGATVTRWKTLTKYLDNETTHDSDAHYPPDIYTVERKISQDKNAISWELVSVLDAEGVKIPSLMILRDICMLKYRVRQNSEWVYFDYGCPYNGDRYYDIYGNQVWSPGNDRCGKGLDDCKLRFPGKQPLPSLLFPGVGKTRVSV